MIVDKATLTGLFCGFKTAKSSGRHFLAIVTPGPKVEKVELPNAPVIPSSVEFGSKVNVLLTQAEQKFSDFNSSFAVAESATITLQK